MKPIFSLGTNMLVPSVSPPALSQATPTPLNIVSILSGPTKTPAVTDRTDVDFNRLPMPLMKVRPVVRAGLNGLARNQPIVIPGIMNKIMDWMGRRVLTRSMSAGMWGTLMNKAAPDSLKVKPRA
ncbi:hypothetical protein [Cognatishimia maritima]|uniref:hypothetical protein n=1 Tax=Cognatishimia maritima TaxID=870908 RepID=UPI0009328003|nr:hypothetical protein [Cognatishimia maritima]